VSRLLEHEPIKLDFLGKRRLSKGIDAHDHRVYDMVEEFPSVVGCSLDVS
jgi:hypothetical protein